MWTTQHRPPTTDHSPRLFFFFFLDEMLRFLAHHELFYPSHSSRGLCVNCDKALRIVVQRGTPHPKPEGARWTGIRWFRMMNYFTGYQGRRPLKLQARVEASSPLLIIAIEDPWFGRVSEWVSERRRNIIHGCSTELWSQSSWVEGNRYLGHGPCTMCHVLINECRMSSNDAVEWLECSRRRKHQTSEFTKTEASGVSIGN